MAKLTGQETIKFIRWLETALKRELGVADVQIIIEMDPDEAWSDDDACLLETAPAGSKDRAS